MSSYQLDKGRTPSGSRPPARTNVEATSSTSKDVTVPTRHIYCNEEPHHFSGLDLLDAHYSFKDDAPAAKHSDIIRPCERSIHKEPHYVCLWCRNQAMHHIAKMIPEKIRGKSLGLCVACGKEALQTLGKAAVQGTIKTPWSGIFGTGLRCRCADGWFCFHCKQATFEIASEKRDAEVNYRTGFKELVYAEEGKPNAFTELKCRCGNNVEKEAEAHRCAGCEGLILKPSS